MKTIKFTVAVLILMIVQIFIVSAQTAVNQDNSQDAEYYLKRGDDYVEQAKEPEAIAAYSECIRLKSDKALCYLNRGSAYARMKKFQESVNDYSSVIRIEPKNVTAYFYRGIVEQKFKKYEEAVSDYKIVLRLDPKNVFMVQSYLREAEEQTAQKKSPNSKNTDNQSQKTEKDWEKIVENYRLKMSNAVSNEDFDLVKKVYQDFLQETKDAGDSKTVRIQRNVLLRELYRTEDKKLQEFVESEMKRLSFDESNKTFTRTGKWQ